MKNVSKVVALLLVVMTLLSVLAVGVSAYSYPMDYTIYYKCGGTLLGQRSGSIDAAADTRNSLSISSPSYSGYVLKKSSDATVTGSMISWSFPASNYVRHGSGSYTVQYEKACTFTAYYLYTNGRQARAPISQTGKSGDTYRISTPNVSGYTPDRSVVSGRYTIEKDSVTVYYYPIVYTLTYDANGGSGAPASGNISYGIGCGISYSKPSRTGYDFLGWSTDKYATSADYQAGGFYGNGYSNATLYAIWSPYEYTVSYNGNGGTGTPSSQTKYYGQTLTISTTQPTKTGYNFMGWSSSSAAQTVNYASGASYTGNRTLNLYAVWSIKTFSISYNANGGAGAPKPQTKVYGEALTLSYLEPTRSGYTFEGWSRTSTGAAIYQPGDSYSSNAGLALYAVWKAIPKVPAKYTVSYNANGGSGAPSAQTKTEGVALTLSSVKPSRAGYTFMGWSTSSNGSGGLYYAGGTYYADAAVTMYAVWSKNAEKYTVSYDANGGSGAPASQIKTENVTLTLSSVYPTRTKYDFLGWSTNRMATMPTYAPGGSYTANSAVTLYAVWAYIPDTYTVSYSANGGSNAPESQTKIENTTLTLSSVKPTKDGSSFLGWGISPDATVAVYQAGGSFTANADTTLYAVWHNDSYDFSASQVTATPGTSYQYDNVTVRFRVDSWDRYNSYTDVPVDVVLNNKVIYSGSVNFSAYGVNYVSFTLNVGSLKGNQTLTARINWDDHNSESRAANNSATGTFTVEKKMEFSTSPVTVNADYVAGNEVISSFYVSNESANAVIPATGLNYDFHVYYLDSNNNPVSVVKQTWSNVVIPANGTNLVYFKWQIPADMVGKLLWCEGTVNGSGVIKEGNPDNNLASFNFYVKAAEASQTPNTRYEATAPGDYTKVNTPATSAGSATWNQWVYENNSFKLVSYGIRITSANPVIAPGSGCKTAVYSGGKWTMKSGYGVTLAWKPILETLSGYAAPSSSAYTAAQNVFALFPEFRYLSAENKYRTLENVGGVYQFIQNPDADGNERIHFIPMYVENGDYTVSVTATQLWTPAGMITATRNANAVTINGTVYDDWYQG